jgi:toxin-antitoxin system PIN domain toxin
MTYLLDVNVWLALAFRRHIHHSAAKQWFEQAADASCMFCRLTQQGFLRLASNSKAVDTDVVSLAGAWKLYDTFLEDSRVGFVVEPANLENYWRLYTESESFSSKIWSDAYLAAFAKAAMQQVVTFDKGFGRHAGSDCIVLS